MITLPTVRSLPSAARALFTADNGTTSTGSTGSTGSTNGTDNTGTGAAAGAIAGGAMGKDEFLKLLVAQLQHQDPLNPMQGDQMASELAQFSSLEQLQQINTTLSSQQTSDGSLLGAVQSGAAINTIGHTVVAIGNQVQVGGSAGASTVTANIAGSGTGTLHIYNSAGVEVGSRDLGSVPSGKQTFDLGNATNGLGDGTYTYSIDVKDGSGNPVSVTTYMSGRIDGVSSSQNGLVLTAGGLTIPYSSVIQILQ